MRFRAVENLDSDGDGFTNIEEIQAHTFPGNAADNPDTVVTTTTVPGGTTTSTAPGSGGALYAANCQGCHGFSGGNLVPTTLSRSQLTTIIGSGRGSMPGFSGALASSQIGSIADALLAWSQTTTTTQPGGSTTTTAGGAVSGSGVYSQYCSGCHGAAPGNLAGEGADRDPGGLGDLHGDRGHAVVCRHAERGADQRGRLLRRLARWGATTTTAAGGSTTTASPGSGAGLYVANCSGCHGAGGGNLVGRGLSSAQIGAITTQGGGGMPAFGSTLSAADIDAIAAYLVSLESGASTTTPPPSSGAGLYAANCAGCHGPAGEGGVGGAIRGSGFGAAALRTLIRDGYGTMPGFGDRLGEADVAALAEFTATLASGGATTTLAPDDGSAGPVAHGGGDAGTGGASWWKIALAIFLALAAAAGFGMLLVRSARQVFRS